MVSQSMLLPTKHNTCVGSVCLLVQKAKQKIFMTWPPPEAQVLRRLGLTEAEASSLGFGDPEFLSEPYAWLFTVMRRAPLRNAFIDDLGTLSCGFHQRAPGRIRVVAREYFAWRRPSVVGVDRGYSATINTPTNGEHYAPLQTNLKMKVVKVSATS